VNTLTVASIAVQPQGFLRHALSSTWYAARGLGCLMFRIRQSRTPRTCPARMARAPRLAATPLPGRRRPCRHSAMQAPSVLNHRWHLWAAAAAAARLRAPIARRRQRRPAPPPPAGASLKEKRHHTGVGAAGVEWPANRDSASKAVCACPAASLQSGRAGCRVT